MKYEKIKNYGADSSLLMGGSYHWITVSKIFAKSTVWYSCFVWHMLIAKHVSTRFWKMWHQSTEFPSFNFCHANWSIEFKTQLTYNRHMAVFRSCNQSSEATSTRPRTDPFKYNSIHYSLISSPSGDRGGTVVNVLCYKSEGRWFDPSWCHWNFSLT